MTGSDSIGSDGPARALLEVLRESQAVGYIGQGPLEPHVAHAVAFAEAVGHQPERALDLGSGGGLPGLVLATTAWQGSELCLLDAGEQRAAFLRRAVVALDLGERVTVERGRAEQLAHEDRLRGRFDVVVARAFGPPAVVAECAAACLEVDGLLVVSEPPDDDLGTRWAHDAELEQLGLERAGSSAVGDARFQRLRVVAPCPARYPRRDGVPTKRPLF